MTLATNQLQQQWQFIIAGADVPMMSKETLKRMTTIAPNFPGTATVIVSRVTFQGVIEKAIANDHDYFRHQLSAALDYPVFKINVIALREQNQNK